MSLTDKQQQSVDLHAKGHGVRTIAKMLGLARSTVAGHLMAASKKGTSPGMSPATPIDGMTVCKTTVQTDAKGNIINEWRRWIPEAADIEAVIAHMEDRVSGKAPALSAAPKAASDDLLLEIPIPDHHMGMLSWAKETGTDYNCDLATSMLVGGVRAVLANSPPVGRAVLVVLGD